MPTRAEDAVKNHRAAAMLFAECARAMREGELIVRESAKDKEFSFQNWVGERLSACNLLYDEPSRNAYPDFRLIDYPVGFEVKGLGYPGREANYDCNSQVPSGMHHGREIYYIFGRYPAVTDGPRYPLLDLVICHGDFLNCDHKYVHQNKNIKGFGSYGDIMIRDRKMYVAPTPFALTKGTAHAATFISNQNTNTPGLIPRGKLTRTETARVVKGYSFDLSTNIITPTTVPNPSATNAKEFFAFRPDRTGEDVIMS